MYNGQWTFRSPHGHMSQRRIESDKGQIQYLQPVALSSNITYHLSDGVVCRFNVCQVNTWHGKWNGDLEQSKIIVFFSPYLQKSTSWHIRWVPLHIIHKSEPITWATMFLNHEHDREIPFISLFKIHNAVSHRCKWKGPLVSSHS